MDILFAADTTIPQFTPKLGSDGSWKGFSLEP